MTSPLILAIDQGTTSSRAIIFDAQANMLHIAQKELPQHYPKPGWVEHNANDIWNDTLAAARTVVEKAGGAKKIAAIGITNQRETTILWDRTTGKPIHRAIVWQDRRTAAFCNDLKKTHGAALEDKVASKTGLLLDPYFSASKIRWILDTVPDARKLAEAGRLAFGTVESFLVWKLTGGRQHVSDVTNAARTGLYDIVKNGWDDDLIALYDIPRSLLPEVKDSVCEFGVTDPEIFGEPIVIGGIAGDQNAATVGQCCFEKGMIKSTYGTGCFALMNIGTTFKKSENRLLTTPAYRLNGQTHYAIEGSIFMAGAIVQWLRDELHIIKHAAETEDLALSVKDNDGVYLVPAFTGLGAPHWQPDARAAIFGLTRGANGAYLARAALEAQAYQTMDLLGAMESDSGIKSERLRVDGGLVANNFVCQFLADITRMKIEVPVNKETTALGAAFLAGLHAGIYNDLGEVSETWRRSHRFSAKMDTAKADAYYAKWQHYVACVIGSILPE